MNEAIHESTHATCAIQIKLIEIVSSYTIFSRHNTNPHFFTEAMSDQGRKSTKRKSKRPDNLNQEKKRLTLTDYKAKRGQYTLSELVLRDLKFYLHETSINYQNHPYGKSNTV